MTPPGRARLPRVVFAMSVFLHLGLLWYFTDRALLTSGEPVLTFDYALHVYQIERASDAFERFGALWSYDPFVLAGQPAGVVEDLTSKSAELFVIAARKLGLGLGSAVNLYVLLAHLGLPFSGWAAARLFGCTRAIAAATSLSWVLLWHFDSLFHWCWYVGMISWATASYLSVLVIALAHHAVRTKKTAHYVALGVLAALLCIVHPFAVLTAAAPLAIVYGMAFRKLSSREHGLLWAGVALAGSTVLIWIGPALRFRHYIGEVDAFLRPTPKYFVFDFFDLLHDVLMTGQPVRSMLRVGFFSAGMVGLLRMYRRRDDRTFPWATLVLSGLSVAYLGGWVWAARQTQPYRQLTPAMLMAVLPALLLVGETVRDAAPRASWTAKSLFAVLAALVVPRFGQNILQFMPTLLPARAVHAGMSQSPPLVPPPPEELPLTVLGHSGASEDYRRVRAFLEAHHRGRGRVVTMDWALGEYLAAYTSIPMLGGIPQRNVPHADAHPLRHDLTPHAPNDDPLRRYFELYAVGWVVFMGVPHPAEFRPDLVQPVATFGLHRIARVIPEPSYVARGRAQSVAQGLNSIRVSGIEGPEIVLRFHWMETLRCRPGCSIRRVPAPGDRVGFIGIDSPPPTLEVYNAYE
jgi:hypothetical protein